jgi:2-polyprenyl-3-methyl-5-hydroxy-6-metoxy-1,4-benzoquinol methylase
MISPDQFNACLHCGSSDIRPLRRYEKDYLVKCYTCKFVFCQRKPSNVELVDHYKLYPRANSISEITLKRYDELLNGFEKYRKTNNLIDVGCGDGFFLMAAKKRNWNVYGTEFSQEALDLCSEKGIQMTRSPLNSDNYQPHFFDVITSFEVIEHINNPLEELRMFHKILRPGGIVYVTTPNFNSVSRDIVGPKWNIIEYPEHLSYYTSRTLIKLFDTAGFNLCDISTTGISLSRIKSSTGSNLVNGGSFSDEAFRKKTEEKFIFRLLKATVNYFLNLFRKGDAIKASFQRN